MRGKLSWRTDRLGLVSLTVQRDGLLFVAGDEPHVVTWDELTRITPEAFFRG